MELLYHYLWKYRLCGRKLPLKGGGTVDVVSPGISNNDAGPDFSNACLRYDGETWVGNVEIHVRASDWFRHHHDSDNAYDNIILHIVAVDDKEVKRPDGTPVPTAVITMPKDFYLAYVTLRSGLRGVRCQSSLGRLGSLDIADWIGSLGTARLQQKANRVADVLRNSNGDWATALFVTLARGLGFGLNSEPFELLARSTPLKFLMRHTGNLTQIEAILFGQAGMLDPSKHPLNQYYRVLCREYQFLSRKYGLKPLSPTLWKYSRTRPGNFPHRRIALLAKTVEDGIPMPDRIIAAEGNQEALRAIFNWKLEGYWKDHASFQAGDAGSLSAGDCGSVSPGAISGGSGELGYQSVTLLLINVVAPVLYAYGSLRGKPELRGEAVDLLTGLKGERNSIIRMWEEGGLKAANAFESQALLHLRKEYCDADRCLDCRFAYRLLKQYGPADCS